MLKGCPTDRSQEEGAEQPKRDPQQGDKPDAIVGKDIEDYNMDINYEGLEPKVEQRAQEQREVDPDTEYVNKEIL